jgi:hypothetical protein
MVDKGLRARLAEGARQTSARYCIERTTAQMIELYQGLLDKRSQKGGEGQ